jgi:hypothetical protein
MSDDYQSESLLNGWNNSLQPLVASHTGSKTGATPLREELTQVQRIHDVMLKEINREVWQLARFMVTRLDDQLFGHKPSSITSASHAARTPSGIPAQLTLPTNLTLTINNLGLDVRLT